MDILEESVSLWEDYILIYLHRKQTKPKKKHNEVENTEAKHLFECLGALRELFIPLLLTDMLMNDL